MKGRGDLPPFRFPEDDRLRQNPRKVYVFEDNFLRYIGLIVGYFKPYPVVAAHMENQTVPIAPPKQIGFQVFLETSKPY
jgi:hypothetical protein